MKRGGVAIHIRAKGIIDSDKGGRHSRAAVHLLQPRKSVRACNELEMGDGSACAEAWMGQEQHTSGSYLAPWDTVRNVRLRGSKPTPALYAQFPELTAASWSTSSACRSKF